MNELKKLKKLKASASLPHEEGGGGCPEVPAHSDAATEDRGVPSSPHAGCHPVPATPVQSGENILSAAASPEGTAKLPTPSPSECGDGSTNSASTPEGCDGSPQGIVPLSSECRDESTKLSARDPEGCDGSPQDTVPLPSGCRDDSTKLSARDLEEDCNGYPAQCATVPESSLPEGSLAAVSPRKSSVQSQDGIGCVINTPRRGSKPVVPPKPPRKKQL